MARGFKKKEPFSDLDNDFKESINNMSDEEIKDRISKAAIDAHENRMAKKKDGDLQEKVAAVKLASEGYRENEKMNRLRIAYGYFILESRGKV